MRGPLRIAAFLAPAVILTLALVAGVAAAQVDKVGFAPVGPVNDPFENFPMDARGEAMGLATTVDPQGPTAFWWNPAPLPGRDGVSVATMQWEYPFDWLHYRPIAIRATRGNLSAGLLWSRLSTDPLPIRTGHEPDGTGGTVSTSEDLYQLGLAADVVPWLAEGSSRWTWTLGVDLRHMRLNLGGFDGSALDLDLGTTVAWTPLADDAGALRLLATAMVRNLSRASLGAEAGTELPRLYHFGLGLEAEMGPAWRGGHLLAWTIAATWRRDLEDLLRDYDSEHLGFELAAAGILSLRTGYRSSGLYSSPDGGWSWGAGLRYPGAGAAGPWASIDYAAFDASNSLWNTVLERWTFTLGFDR